VASKANVWLLHEDKEYEYEKGINGSTAYTSSAFPRSESGYFA